MSERILHTPRTESNWWREAVIYQIYPRSFASSKGKIGDLPGITARLPQIKELGVDAVWLSPFYLSPQCDAGYDVADYCQVDPMFGTNDDAFALIERAHELDLRVIVDLVPNHSSDQHKWFQAALAAGPGTPDRERYYFRDGSGEDGNEPPNDWLSIFGGHAWTRVCDRADAPGSAWENDKQWYLHLFDSGQPDWNWDHPDVHEHFKEILRFWLDAGVDGFRIDVAHGLVKEKGLPNWQYNWDMVSGGAALDDDIPPAPQWNRPGVHEVYREWRAVLDEYPGERILVAEAWVDDPEDLAKYVRADEMNQAFNFEFLSCPFEPDAYRQVIADSLRNLDAVEAPTTWVLSNHDVVRATSRMGLPETGKGPNGIRPFETQPDAKLGHLRALAAHVLQSALPGSCYIYQGEELSLPEHMALPDEVREDPAFFRTEGAEAGRDGCRVPLPWEADQPGFGFSPNGETWLPQPADWREFARDIQDADPDSSVNFFKKLYRLRTELALAHAELVDVSEPGSIHFISRRDDRPDVHIRMAFAEPVAVNGEILIASQPVENGMLPANSSVWYR